MEQSKGGLERVFKQKEVQHDQSSPKGRVCDDNEEIN